MCPKCKKMMHISLVELRGEHLYIELDCECEWFGTLECLVDFRKGHGENV
jgi:hypothetical protein